MVKSCVWNILGEKVWGLVRFNTWILAAEVLALESNTGYPSNLEKFFPWRPVSIQSIGNGWIPRYHWSVWDRHQVCHTMLCQKKGILPKLIPWKHSAFQHVDVQYMLFVLMHHMFTYKIHLCPQNPYCLEPTSLHLPAGQHQTPWGPHIWRSHYSQIWMIQHFHFLLVRPCDVHHADTADMEKDRKTNIATVIYRLRSMVLQWLKTQWNN